MTTRVAIYARVSTGEQSPEAQLRELRLYAEHRGFPITREVRGRDARFRAPPAQIRTSGIPASGSYLG